LLHDPPVLLLDEPDTGLDVTAFGLLQELACSRDRTILLTTHNLAAGLRIGSRVVVLAHGHLVHQEIGVSPRDTSTLTALLLRLAAPAQEAA
jgi:ABC-type multidrug transport system ATPase subunit